MKEHYDTKDVRYISFATISILRDHLDMRKLLARWLLCLLLVDGKSNHMTTSKGSLALFHCSPKDVSLRLITVDEASIDHNPQETI